MYEVEMKYADLFNVDTLNFTCENFNINDKDIYLKILLWTILY